MRPLTGLIAGLSLTALATGTVFAPAAGAAPITPTSASAGPSHPAADPGIGRRCHKPILIPKPPKDSEDLRSSCLRAHRLLPLLKGKHGPKPAIEVALPAAATPTPTPKPSKPAGGITVPKVGGTKPGAPSAYALDAPVAATPTPKPAPGKPAPAPKSTDAPKYVVAPL